MLLFLNATNAVNIFMTITIHNMIQYGLISQTDARTLEKTLDLICNARDEVINVCEIGIFDGQTARGIYEYVTNSKYIVVENDIPTVLKYKCNYTAIDNNKDKEVFKPFEDCTLIIGNSNEVYNALADNSQHLIFVDGCHALPCVISDFFCYAGKVKVGGYMAFHDTGKHIKPFKDWQRMGSEGDADMYISVRKALHKVGLINKPMDYINRQPNWELIFDEADPMNSAGGVCVFKKLY